MRTLSLQFFSVLLVILVSFYSITAKAITANELQASFKTVDISFVDSHKVAKSTSSMVYTSRSLKKLLKSNKVACLSLDKIVILSKGFQKALGSNKMYCTNARAKQFGFEIIGKNNLEMNLFRAFVASKYITR